MQGKIQQIQHHLNEAKEVSLKLLIEAKEVSLKLLIEVQWSCSPTAPWMYGRDEKCKVRFKDSTISMSLHEAKEISPKLLIEAKEVSRKLLASNQSIPCPYFEPSKLQSLSLKKSAPRSCSLCSFFSEKHFKSCWFCYTSICNIQ